LAAVVGGDLARGGYQILQRGGWRSEEVARELLKAASLNRRIERGFEKWISTSIVATCLGLVFLAAEILLMSALT
jgi:glutamine amidotransferase PdxT